MLQPTGYPSPAWLRLSGCVVDLDALMRGTEVGSSLWLPVAEVARHPFPGQFLDHLVPAPFEGSLPRQVICRQGHGPIAEHRIPPAFVFLWRDLEGGPLLLIGTGNPWQWRRHRGRPSAQPPSVEAADDDGTQPTLFSPPNDEQPFGVRDPARFARPHGLGALTYSVEPVRPRLVVYRSAGHFTNIATGRGRFARLASLFASAGATGGLVMPPRCSTAPGANLIVLSVARAFDAPVASFPSGITARWEIPASALPGIRPATLRSETLTAAARNVVPTRRHQQTSDVEQTFLNPEVSEVAPMPPHPARRAAQAARRLKPLHAAVTGTSTLPAIRAANLSRRPTRALSVFAGRSGRHPRRLALASVLAALAVGTLHVLSALNVARAGDLRLQLDDMSAGLTEVRHVAGQVRELETLLANTAPKVLSASAWITLLAALDEARPPGLHLTSVGSAVGSWVDVRGSATSTHEVTQYLASLATTRTIDGADVTFDPDDRSVVFALRVAIDDADEDSE